MAERSPKELDIGTVTMNGNHTRNGVSNPSSPLLQANGIANDGITKRLSEHALSAKSHDKQIAIVNGTSSGQATRIGPTTSVRMDELPEEVLAMLGNIPDDAYVPMARLVSRVTRSCWTDLAQLLKDLAQVQIADPADVVNRLAGEITSPDDRSESNRRKKLMMWSFAEDYKRELIKLLVILQWSANTQENRLTIALNYHLHQVRSSFMNANSFLDRWLTWIPSRQDAAPDLAVAAEMLAAGRLARLPDLGYAEEQNMTEKQMLNTVRRLNNVLSVRMMAEDNLPQSLRTWRIHDGRVTFSVPEEFDISLSVLSEQTDATFQTVDVKFNFWPMPTMSQDLLDQILIITNNQLHNKGLEGAFKFLHELVLSQKLKELHHQAVKLMQGLWSGHLQVEMLKRTLIVQYWAARPSAKSWIEIVINSGRTNRHGELSSYPIPYINLRWMRHGKLVIDHEVVMDLRHLSFETVLNDIVTQHANLLFDGIYTKLSTNPLFSGEQLSLEQTTSLTDCQECILDVELSRREKISLTCDPVTGTVVVSPAGERTNRLQSELSRSKNIVDDFANRFSALRCSMVQADLLVAMKMSSWQSLPGRRPSYSEVKELFGPSALRAVFFNQPDWHGDWMLAASLGTDGDLWWLVCEPEFGTRIVQHVTLSPIHLQRLLSPEYFKSLAKHLAAMITLQVNRQSMSELDARTSLPQWSGADTSGMKVCLDPNKEKFGSIDQSIVVSSFRSEEYRDGNILLIFADLKAPSTILHKLASAGLDKSIKIRADERRLRLQFACRVGESKVVQALAQMHYIDDLLNCIKLVHQSTALQMSRLTLKEIEVTYHDGPTHKLALALLLDGPAAKSRIHLLPEGANPHELISQHMDSVLSKHQTLSDGLKAVLSFLQTTLPLVTCLQYMQGFLKPQEVPKMASLNLGDSHKWLRMHIMVRDMVTFGVHFYAKNSAFKHNVDTQETPEPMLVRLEIEPLFSESGSRISWVVRPAIEEFKDYTRPSFASHLLRERVQDRIWRATNKSWINNDSSAMCLYDEPYQLMIEFHNTLLEWLKEAVKVQSEASPAAAKKAQSAQTPVHVTRQNGSAQNGSPNSQSQQQPQIQGQSMQQMHNRQNQAMQNKQQHQHQQAQQAMQNRQQQQQQSQAQGQSFFAIPQGNRPNSTQVPTGMNQSMYAGMNPQMNMPQNQHMNIGMGINNGSSRVMTAAPQQVRQVPSGQQQRRPGQPGNMQGRGGNQGQGQPRQQPNPKDVINLD